MECSLSASHFFSAGRPPLASTSEARIATAGRCWNSRDSYSRAATVKVTAMLPPTMIAMAIQNSTKIRRNKLCMRSSSLRSGGERVPGAADVLDLGIFSVFQIEFAAQIADVRVDAAVVRHEFAPECL